jgi:hypothetical protein
MQAGFDKCQYNAFLQVDAPEVDESASNSTNATAVPSTAPASSCSKATTAFRRHRDYLNAC